MKYLLLALLTTGTAYANEGTEFWYQSGAGTQDVTVTLSSESIDAETSGGDYKASNTGVEVEYQRGFDEHRAMGVAVKYSTGTSELGTSEDDIAGLHDLDFFYRAYHAMGSGNLRYGANLEVSPGDSETESNGDENNYSGGITLIPYIGWEQTQDSCSWGAKLSMDLRLTPGKYDDKSSTPTTGENEGGEETVLTGFYEHKFDDSMRLGVALNYITTADEEQTPDGNPTTKNEVVDPQWRLDVYLPVAMGNGTLLPSIQYLTSSDDKIDTTTVDSYTGMNLAVGYRMMF